MTTVRRAPTFTEQQLIDVIEKYHNHDDTKLAVESTITRIDELVADKDMTCPIGTLSYINKTGNSFLALSIKNRADLVTEQLLQVLNDNDTVLFYINDDNQSLIHLAAESKDLKTLEILIQRMRVRDRDKLKEILLSADKTKRNTCLHYAATELDFQNNAIHATKMILRHAKSLFPNQLQKYCDQTNIDGNRPLHLAINTKNLETAAFLVKEGADWNLVNHSPISAIDAIFKLSFPLKQMFFLALEIYESESTLNEKNNYGKIFQQKFLDFYLNKVIIKNDKEVIKDYYALASLCSLKDLFISKFAMDSKFINKVKTNSNLKVDKLDMELQKINNQRMRKLSEDQLKILKNKESRINNTNILKDISEVWTHQENIDFGSIIIKKQEPNKKINEQEIINQDLKTLSDLINIFNKKVEDLEANPRSSRMWKQLAFAIPIFIGLFFLEFYAWLIDTIINMNNDPRAEFCDLNNGDKIFCDTRNFMGIFLLTASIAGIFLTCALYGIGLSISKNGTDVPIDKREWQWMLDRLQEKLLKPIRDSEVNITSPKHNELIKGLNTHITSLHDNQKRDEVISGCKGILGVLVDMRKEVNMSQYPKGLLKELTIFSNSEKKKAADVVIDMPVPIVEDVTQEFEKNEAVTTDGEGLSDILIQGQGHMSGGESEEENSDDERTSLLVSQRETWQNNKKKKHDEDYDRLLVVRDKETVDPENRFEI